MANRILPEGLKWINMKGDVKAIAQHLASDVNLQKSLGFYPCDENGVAITQAEVEQVEVKKKDVEVAVEPIIEPTVIIPDGSNIINPLEEDKSQYESGSIEETIYNLHKEGKGVDEIKEATGANKNTIKKVINANQTV